MNKMIALAAVAVLALAPSFAKAEDAAHTATTHTETTATTATTTEAKEMTLKDGTKVSVEGESVFVVAADGTKTPAPDAEHEMADGTKVKTMGGKIVK